MGQRYAVLDGPETDAETVQELWLAVVENREITVELVRPRALARSLSSLGLEGLEHDLLRPAGRGVGPRCRRLLLSGTGKGIGRRPLPRLLPGAAKSNYGQNVVN